MNKIEQIAKTCHQANKGICEAFGDFTQVNWEQAPSWQQESAITGVKFNIDNPDAPASASHDSWLAEKERTGWKLGPVKDPIRKEHPCFVPYEELPPEQKVKDHVFKAIVSVLK